MIEGLPLLLILVFISGFLTALVVSGFHRLHRLADISSMSNDELGDLIINSSPGSEDSREGILELIRRKRLVNQQVQAMIGEPSLQEREG